MQDGESTGTRRRRRGQTLVQAICQAALTELCAVGYADLSMEGVADRARTGKAALYSRWSSKQELVLDALLHALPDQREIPLPGTVRGDLITLLSVMSELLSGRTAYPGIAVIGEMLRESELRAAFRTKIVEPRLALIQTILQRGVARGEVAPHAASPLYARVGPALVMQSLLLTGAPPTKHEITQIVDRVIIPLLLSRVPDDDLRSAARSRPSKQAK